MKKLGVLCLGHLLVDAACAYLCLGAAAQSDALQTRLLLYNFCAFALQMPLGVLADRLQKNMPFAALGAGLVAVSFAAVKNPTAAVLFAGLGNAFYHIGGGTDTLLASGGKCTPLGLFVAPGALGILLGTLAAKNAFVLPGFVPPVLLCALCAVLPLLGKRAAPPMAQPAALPSVRAAFPAVALLFGVVFLRSFAGLQMDFPWKTGTASVFFATAAAVGKALGGVCGDRMGTRKTCLVSLLLAGLLFCFSGKSAVCGITAVLLFNFTMPLTLWAAARALRGFEGFSFGLLTFALFLGLLPSYFGFSLPAVALSVGVCGFSAVLLLPGLRRVCA